MNTMISVKDICPESGHFFASGLLALNLGTTTGWAIRGCDGLITSGAVSFRPGRFDGGGMRYLRFTNWLTEIDGLSGPIAAIWFEEVRRHVGTDAAHVYGGLMATFTHGRNCAACPMRVSWSHAARMVMRIAAPCVTRCKKKGAVAAPFFQ